ncbi:MAG: 23S rRNA (uracil(1939)-C(5))-methyltransferase RlmD [Syntrophomonadaceae bacterium]|nr:23S rRNA (uracil(1939)-C(5))-methyltransferase RlmD [Syntrophomonadaceae bacterium]
MRCIIDGLTHSGEGVARIEGKATFVPFTIPGETVDVKIVEEKKSFQRARLENVVNPSPDRVAPPCLYYFSCGGCSYQHVQYPRQLELKRQVVREALKRIGGIEIEVNPVLGMDNPWHYRNKVEWHTWQKSGQLVMGYYLNDSRRLMDISSCLLISSEMQEYSNFIREHGEELKLPDNCEIVVRQSSASRELMLIFIGSGASQIDFARMLNFREAASIYSIEEGISRLHYGDQTLPETLDGIDYQISPLSFFQVNHRQTEKMLGIIRDYVRLESSDNVLDAYCGTGSIALNLAGSARLVVGVEAFKSAVKDAKRNAFHNHVANCKFIKGPCEDIVPGLEEHFHAVILDPPRAGCKEKLLEAIIKNKPKKIIYVSCNPATLARDLAVLVQGQYAVEQVQPIDMFPQTSHVEVVCLLERA